LERRQPDRRRTENKSMDLRPLRLAGALLCAAVLTAAPAAAQAPPASDASPAAQLPRLSSLPRDAKALPPPVVKPAAARERVARPAPDPYRCHPTEDIACTVVRETPQGTVIVTMRPAGAAAKPAAIWSVVSGSPPGPAGVTALGGTIYVVPTSSPEPRADLSHPGPANGAPILD
jgi:hypothetical protein